MKNIPNKKRVIADYKNITQDLLQLLSDEYPDGFDGETIFFTNAKGERVEAVPLETEDTKYLVKISAQLVTKFEAFQDDDEDDDNDSEGDDLADTDDVAGDFDDD
jgi:DNA-directed RNA polymerase subunit delta